MLRVNVCSTWLHELGSERGKPQDRFELLQIPVLFDKSQPFAIYCENWFSTSICFGSGNQFTRIALNKD
jgi:hypothetical protein